MKLILPWQDTKAATLILSLEGEVANLIFMLLQDKHITAINNGMDKINPSDTDLKAEVIVCFLNLLKSRIISATEGKSYALGYLGKIFDEADFIDKLLDERKLSSASYLEVKSEMQILEKTVVQNVLSKSYMFKTDELRAELVKTIVNYPVDAAMVLTFLLEG
jgi:flagellar motor switch protein FliG